MKYILIINLFILTLTTLNVSAFDKVKGCSENINPNIRKHFNVFLDKASACTQKSSFNNSFCQSLIKLHKALSKKFLVYKNYSKGEKRDDPQSSSCYLSTLGDLVKSDSSLKNLTGDIDGILKALEGKHTGWFGILAHGSNSMNDITLNRQGRSANNQRLDLSFVNNGNLSLNYFNSVLGKSSAFLKIDENQQKKLLTILDSYFSDNNEKTKSLLGVSKQNKIKTVAVDYIFCSKKDTKSIVQDETQNSTAEVKVVNQEKEDKKNNKKEGKEKNKEEKNKDTLDCKLPAQVQVGESCAKTTATNCITEGRELTHIWDLTKKPSPECRLVNSSADCKLRFTGESGDKRLYHFDDEEKKCVLPTTENSCKKASDKIKEDLWGCEEIKNEIDCNDKNPDEGRKFIFKDNHCQAIEEGDCSDSEKFDSDMCVEKSEDDYNCAANLIFVKAHGSGDKRVEADCQERQEGDCEDTTKIYWDKTEKSCEIMTKTACEINPKTFWVVKKCKAEDDNCGDSVDGEEDNSNGVCKLRPTPPKVYTLPSMKRKPAPRKQIKWFRGR